MKNSVYLDMASNEETSYISDIDEKLKNSCPNVQLKEVPAINQKRLVAFINHFTINMVEYLNKFAQTCQQRLFQCDEKLRRMEDELSLLEAKLNSIPEARGVAVPETSSSSSNYNVTKEVPSSSLSDSVSESSEILSKSVKTEDNSSTTNDETPTKFQEEEDLTDTAPTGVDISKYQKMVQFGVPLPAVKLKMQQEGFDPLLLDKR